MKKITRVFISYARADQEMAKKLYADLSGAQVEPWLDTESLLPGQNWKHEVTKAIRRSAFFIALLSTNSLSKIGFVQKELKVACEVLDLMPANQVFLIPARIEDCEPADERLQELQWVDLFPSYDKGLEKIVRLIIG